MITTSNKKAIKTASRVNDNGMLTTQLEKRAFERFPANLQARLFFGNMIYSGMVTNLSKNGMFVSTKVKFPVNTEFMMVVLLNNRTLKMSIKVRRAINKEGYFHSEMDSGIGIELLDTPQNYLDYVGTRKSSLQVSY